MYDDSVVCSCVGCHFKTAVFDGLDEGEILSVCGSKHEIDYKKGDIIIEEGTEIKEFLYLKTGLVKSYKCLSGEKQQILNIATPLEFVSLLSVFSETHYKFSIAALDDTTVCRIDLEMIKKLIIRNGKFGLSIMQKMSENADKIILQNLSLNSKHLRGRIAYILLLFSDYIYNSNSFDLPISRKEIAQLIDMTTENVIRILSEFRKDNIIRISGKNIEILNSKSLQQISQHG